MSRKLDPAPGAIAADQCPEKHLHTPCPEGYLQWHAWAEEKAKTHKQRRCPGCNLFAIWEPK